MKTLIGTDVTITGHRPAPGEPRAVSDARLMAADDCLELFRPRIVRTGMALGWDQDIAMGCWLPSDRSPGRGRIPYVAYIPCADQQRLWPSEEQATYGDLLAAAAEVVYTSRQPYHPALMHHRNEVMIEDTSERGFVLACFDGRQKGGTWGALQTAKLRGKPIVNAWPTVRARLDGFECMVFEGDMWWRWSDVHLFCFTANSELGGPGRDYLVMGAGIAKEVRDRYPDVPGLIAAEIKRIGAGHLGEYGLLVSPHWPVGKLAALQTKFRAVEPSDLSLVRDSLKELARWASDRPDTRVAVNFPGVGLGGLDVKTVWPLLKLLPFNVEVWASPGHLTGGLS